MAVQADLMETSQPKKPSRITFAGTSEAADDVDEASVSSQVLRLLVTLLGLDVHERPNPWAEVWLSFQDKAGNQLGLQDQDASRSRADDNSSYHVAGAHRDGPMLSERSEDYKEGHQAWQFRVLKKLQQCADEGTLESDCDDDFGEQLKLAEYMLNKITHAVGVLQDPEQQERPIILREYTEKMVVEVSQDLRQWLEQLATLVSIYHVRLLNLEGERSGLASTLLAEQAKVKELQHEKTEAVQRYDALQNHWKEDKMRRRAEALLGIQAEAGDALIYSQQDVDEMQKDWERDSLEPLLQEIAELRAKHDELVDRLKDKSNQMRDLRKAGQKQPTIIEAPEGLSTESTAILVAVLSGLSEKTNEDNLCEMLLKLIKSIKSGGADLKLLLQQVTQMPSPPQPSTPVPPEPVQTSPGPQVAPPQTDNLAIPFLKIVTQELNALESKLKQCPLSSGANKLASLAKWMKEMLGRASTMCASGPNASHGVQSQSPPKWDLGALQRVVAKPLTKQTGTNTEGNVQDTSAAEEVIRAQVESEWRKRLEQLQEQLEQQVAMAKAAEKAKTEEAMRALQEAAEAAEKRARELRNRLLEMERLLKARGLGKEAAEVINESGLSEYLQESVFERLYKDAMDRMRRAAEKQMARLKETSEAFFLNLLAQCNLMPPKVLSEARARAAGQHMAEKTAFENYRDSYRPWPNVSDLVDSKYGQPATQHGAWRRNDSLQLVRGDSSPTPAYQASRQTTQQERSPPPGAAAWRSPVLRRSASEVPYSRARAMDKGATHLQSCLGISTAQRNGTRLDSTLPKTAGIGPLAVPHGTRALPPVDQRQGSQIMNRATHRSILASEMNAAFAHSYGDDAPFPSSPQPELRPAKQKLMSPSQSGHGTVSTPNLRKPLRALLQSGDPVF